MIFGSNGYFLYFNPLQNEYFIWPKSETMGLERMSCHGHFWQKSYIPPWYFIHVDSTIKYSVVFDGQIDSIRFYSRWHKTIIVYINKDEWIENKIIYQNSFTLDSPVHPILNWFRTDSSRKQNSLATIILNFTAQSKAKILS
jgi:hypothetical protein